MSIKVLKHGRRETITNPVNGQKTEMITISFTEQGRSGGNAQMSDTSAFLSQFTGANSGLDNIRVHTHAVRADLIDNFPVGKELRGFINRNLFSTPQTSQQEAVRPRMIDGRPTFFTTYISANAEKDRDLRVPNDVLMRSNPEYFFSSTTSAAIVEVLEVEVGGVINEEHPVGVGEAVGVGEDLGQGE